jgi:hypothetical protein
MVGAHRVHQLVVRQEHETRLSSDHLMEHRLEELPAGWFERSEDEEPLGASGSSGSLQKRE